MLVGFVLAFASTVGFAFLGSFGTLMAARCVQGLGSSLMTIAGINWEPQQGAGQGCFTVGFGSDHSVFFWELQQVGGSGWEGWVQW